jgi:hypothetical protein
VPCFTIRGRKAPVSSCHGLDGHHSHLALERQLVKVAQEPEARVVADADDLELADSHPLDQGGAGSAVAEVARLDVDAHVACGAQLAGELVEALLAARAERQVVAALRELARELGADPRRGAGDEDGGAGRRGREGHARILARGRRDGWQWFWS